MEVSGVSSHNSQVNLQELRLRVSVLERSK